MVKNIKAYSMFPANKVLVGLPLYGGVVKKGQPLTIQHREVVDPVSAGYEEKGKECAYVTAEDQAVFLPCLSFLRARLDYLRGKGMGVYFWEGGQGPESLWHAF
jgi:hypothetical protein